MEIQGQSLPPFYGEVPNLQECHVEVFGKTYWQQAMISDRFSTFLNHLKAINILMTILMTLGDDIFMTWMIFGEDILTTLMPGWKSCDDPAYDWWLSCWWHQWALIMFIKSRDSLCWCYMHYTIIKCFMMELPIVF